MYTTLLPLKFLSLARVDAICINKVDFPIPGSPAKSETDPRTNPPPNTLFISSLQVRDDRCVCVRVCVWVCECGGRVLRKGSEEE